MSFYKQEQYHSNSCYCLGIDVKVWVQEVQDNAKNNTI